MKMKRTAIAKLFSPLKGVYLSWFSRDFYNEVAQSWQGVGFRFLMVVLGLYSLIIAAVFQFHLSAYLDDFIVPVFRQAPQLNLDQGKLSMDRRSPYVVEDPRYKGKGKPFMIFDLREDAPLPDPDLNGMFFIRDKELLQFGGRRETIDLSGNWKTPLFPQDSLKSLGQIKVWSGSAVFLVLFSTSFFFIAIQVFLYGLLAFVLSGLLRRPLQFVQAARLSTVALLPVITLDFLQRLTGLFLPLWTLVSVLLTIGYLAFAIRSISVTLNRPGFET